MNKKYVPSVAFRFSGGKKKGRVVKVRDEEGKVVRKIRLHKCLPTGCKTAKRTCIKCLKTVIRKNDSNYDLKICKGCS